MLKHDLIRGAKGVSDYTGGRITARQVYSFAERGLIPVIRMGKALYFRASDIEAAFTAGGNRHDR